MSDESKEIIVQQPTELVQSATDVKQQVQLIQKVMEQVMIPNEHYGTIPGCKKPSLYKPGAEKLLLTFRLSPDYEILDAARLDDFIYYEIRCKLTHIVTGETIGHGMGACNSKEKKYATMAVSDYKATQLEKDRALSQEKRTYTKDGKTREYNVYIIAQNPWDIQNTILKMACKRALIAAVLNATAASDIFMQDLEGEETPETTYKKEPPNPPQRKTETQNQTGPTEKQIARLFAISKKAKWEESDIKDYYKREFKIESSKDLTRKQYEEICNYMTDNSL